MVGIISIANRASLFSLLPGIHSFGLFTAFEFVLLLCYGCGFGTMPAFCADYFGSREVGPSAA